MHHMCQIILQYIDVDALFESNYTNDSCFSNSRGSEIQQLLTCMDTVRMPNPQKRLLLIVCERSKFAGAGGICSAGAVPFPRGM